MKSFTTSFLAVFQLFQYDNNSITRLENILLAKLQPTLSLEIPKEILTFVIYIYVNFKRSKTHSRFFGFVNCNKFKLNF